VAIEVADLDEMRPGHVAAPRDRPGERLLAQVGPDHDDLPGLDVCAVVDEQRCHPLERALIHRRRCYRPAGLDRRGSMAAVASLAEQWDEIVQRQPRDWSSLYFCLRLRDPAQSEETALAISPLNPWHDGDWRSGVFHFRAARRYGYGAAAQLCRKRLSTVDGLGIVGTLALERQISDVRPAHTQGVA
jgi:hypothetical protein